MKRAWAFAMTLAVLMAGCGVKENDLLHPELVEKKESMSLTEAETAPPSEKPPETKPATAQHTATSPKPTTQAPEPATEPPKPVTEAPRQTVAISDVINAYENAIKAFCIAAQLNSQNGEYDNYSVDFAIHDVDNDGIPELFMETGTCEADASVSAFSYKGSGLQPLASDLPGGHTSFGYDRYTHQLVLCMGQMGCGQMTWYDMADSSFQVVRESESFQFGSGEPDDELPSYEEVMADYDVNDMEHTLCSIRADGITSYYYENRLGYLEKQGISFVMFDYYLSNHGA